MSGTNPRSTNDWSRYMPKKDDFGKIGHAEKRWAEGHYVDLYGDTLTVTGNITVSGTVDGVDIVALKNSYDAHLHDGDTLQCDGINSDGGDFSFNTTGNVIFNSDIVTSDIHPPTTNTGTIGTAARVFGGLYAKDAILSGAIVLNGSTTIDVNESLDISGFIDIESNFSSDTNDAYTIVITADYGLALVSKSTSAPYVGPELALKNYNAANPSYPGIGGSIKFYGKNNAGNMLEAGRINSGLIDTTTGSEYTDIDIGYYRDGNFEIIALGKSSRRSIPPVLPEGWSILKFLPLPAQSPL